MSNLPDRLRPGRTPRTHIMSHPGWFHRSADGGKLQWTPDTPHDRPSPTGHDQDALLTGPQSLERFPVCEVNGGTPTDLDEFLGVTTFTVVKGGLSYRVFGTGERLADSVRFQQQDLNVNGRDSRTWTVTATPAGIVAQPADSSN